MIILVRHGEATHHTQHLTGGWTDSELTEKGVWQLRQVGAALAADFAGKTMLPRILCSDLQRAVHSANLIADALGRSGEVEPLACLREKNNGQAAGLTEREAKLLYQPPARLNELDHRNYPGGETRREFYHRTVEGLCAAADWEHENLIVVAHKGSVQNLIFAWIGLDIEDVNRLYFSVDVLPASVSVLGINRWQEHAIFCLNETSPLRGVGAASGELATDLATTHRVQADPTGAGTANVASAAGRMTVPMGYGIAKFKFGGLDGFV